MKKNKQTTKTKKMETKSEKLQIPEEIIDIIKESFYKEIVCVYYILHEL